MRKNWIKKGIVSLIVMAVFLAPFSDEIKIGKDNNLALEIKESRVVAQNTAYCSDPNLATSNGTIDGTILCVYMDASKTTGSKAYFLVTLEKTKDGYGQYENSKVAEWNLYNKKFSVLGENGELLTNNLPDGVTRIDYGETPEIKLNTVEKQTLSFSTNKSLEPSTNYFLVITLSKNHQESVVGPTGIPTQRSVRDYTLVTTITFTSGSNADNPGGGTITDANTQNRGDFDNNANSDPGFGCGILNPGGCVAQVLYWLTVAVSLVPLVAAYFLDFFVYYSTNSSSYSNEFVSQAWAAVRDIANMFFILVLLYIAIKTILGLNVTDNKKLISAVVVVALVINFSLFTTKVVIDASNILAKVFYNNITSKDASAPKNTDGSLQDSKAGVEGQKSISIGLVSTFEPQQLLMTTYNNLGLGFTIFLTLLLIGVYLYLAYIFFSIALLFVARVVSLWISMVFSPISFLSYSLPFSVPGFGHKDWWKSLIESAFLAPAFIFFLYVIILFTGFLKDITYADTQNLSTFQGILQHLMSILIPFVIIVMLLTKAKKLAVKLSGDMGAAITKVGGIIGGLALGGAALGGAAIGRLSAGRIAAAASRSEDAIHYGKAKVSFDDKMAKWKKNGGIKPTWETHKAEYIENGGKNFEENIWTKLGGRINASQILSKDVNHARHEIDEAKKKAGLEGVSNANLSGIEKEKIQDTFIKDKKSEIEGDIRNGYDSKGKIKNPNDPTGKTFIQSENEFKASKRSDIAREVHQQGNPADIDQNASDGLSNQGRKKVEDQLNQAYNVMLKDLIKQIGKVRFSHLEKEAEVKIGGLNRIVSRSTSGSYDIRNIPILKTDKREGLGTKATVGLIAAVAAGMRAGLKSSLNINAGTPQKEIGKDLGNLITSALKSAKIDVKLSEGGSSHGSSGGGHGGSVGDHSGNTSHGGGGHAPATGGHAPSGGGHGAAHH